LTIDEPTPGRAVIERLYRESSRQLLVAAFALTGDLGEAEDAVQEAFVRAFAHPWKVARADNPVAWMRTVTLNIARTRYRRKRRLQALLPRMAEPEPVSLPGLSPERIVLMNAIRRLPRAQLEAITLFYLADMSVQDTATVLGVAQSVVRTRLHRGRKTLAEFLGVDEIVPEDTAAAPQDAPIWRQA
jgi:RNA polymerase sigma-70 factor (ECF subfamily)